MESRADNRRQDVASESFSHHKRWLAGLSNFALEAIILHEMRATQLMEAEHSLLYPVRTQFLRGLSVSYNAIHVCFLQLQLGMLSADPFQGYRYDELYD